MGESRSTVRFLPDGLVEFKFSVEPPNYYTRMIEKFLEMMAKKRKSKEPKELSETISGSLEEIRDRLTGG